jgi:DNA-binding NtrC family response regulator
MSDPARILVVDDEKVAVRNLTHVLKREGYEVVGRESGAAGLKVLKAEPFDLVLTDLRMEKVDGMAILKACRELQPGAEVIMITGHATLTSAVDAMKAGAFHYIAKPFRLDEVRHVVREALDKVRLKRENRELHALLDSFRGRVRIVTQNDGLRRLLDTARQVAPTGVNVLITGESGTGKELLARFIHEHSARADKPFLAVNCGAFNDALLASELFGHRKGAFTGAVEARTGLVEAVSGGTLFLDEITEMSPPMQVKLLRVLQEQEVLPVGANEPRPVDVRFIAATNRDPQEAIAAGVLRQDLYFRLNVVTLRLPALAERRDDIPLLSHYFLKKHAGLMGREVSAIAPETLEILGGYGFPGNVRELENIIERGVALASGDSIEVHDLPEDLQHLEVQAFRKPRGSLPTLEDQEREYIQWVLDKTHGNRTQAAQILGIDRVSLWRKINRYGLE